MPTFLGNVDFGPNLSDVQMAIKIDSFGSESWLSGFRIQERKDLHLGEGEENYENEK